jgi:hypothetical protein
MSKYTQARVDRRTIFTAMDGQEIPFKPFSWLAYENALEGLRQEYRDRGEQIDRPQYVVQYESGSQQTFDHDEISITQVSASTLPEDKERVIAEQQAQWAAWQETTKKFDLEGNDLLWDFVRNDSLTDLKLPADSAWEDKQRRRKAKIPEDPEEKLMYYLNTELLKSTADRLEFLETIVLVSRGMVEEAHLETAKRLFRNQIWSDSLEQLEEWDSAGKTEDSETGELVSQPAPDIDQGAQRVEIDEGAMERSAL